MESARYGTRFGTALPVRVNNGEKKFRSVVFDVKHYECSSAVVRNEIRRTREICEKMRENGAE